MLYKTFIRPILFLLEPEKVHHITVGMLKFAQYIPGVKSLFRSIFCFENKALEREVFGLKFKNPVGLAAGFDKDATMIDLLEPLGFGFIEIGTLTPKGQLGNPKPRLFRLPEDKALINRMGFNNKGVQDAVKRLATRKSNVLVGGNIGKNKITDNKFANRDYEFCFEALYNVVDYFVVNVSSPNTPNLRELQDKKPLTNLLNLIKTRRDAKKKIKPILLKIAPDLTDKQLMDIVDIIKQTGIDGIIATNTTIDRSGLKSSEKTIEDIGAGGVSGLPVKDKSNAIIRLLRKELGNDFPIIGVGGIMTPEDAVEKIKSGATLVQVYTGLIYNGPSFIKQINKAILKAGV